MEYIITRNFELPTDKKEMEQSDWFNLWKRKFFPYAELLVGDTLYWFDRTQERLVWKTKVIKIDRFAYKKKKEILGRYPTYESSRYFEDGSEAGYFITYKVKVSEKLDSERPNGFQFPQIGWIRVDQEMAQNWFGGRREEDQATLDESIDDQSKGVFEILRELNDKMRDVDPQRIKRAITTTIRKDTQIVRALNKAYQFSCQFQKCDAQIRAKPGGLYVEVAHVEPVKIGGKSVLGNLLVLCPNHHKEFDLGRLEIIEQTSRELSGALNGKPFTFKFEL
jgi:hypothetical protein